MLRRTSPTMLLGQHHAASPELLSLIFLQSLPDDGLTTPALNDAPLHLTWVCSRWREVALSIPDLWNSFRVAPAISNDQRVSWVEAWLRRSRNAPLTIELSDQGTGSVPEERGDCSDYASVALTMILPVGHQGA